MPSFHSSFSRVSPGGNHHYPSPFSALTLLTLHGSPEFLWGMHFWMVTGHRDGGTGMQGCGKRLCTLNQEGSCGSRRRHEAISKQEM